MMLDILDGFWRDVFDLGCCIYAAVKLFKKVCFSLFIVISYVFKYSIQPDIILQYIHVDWANYFAGHQSRFSEDTPTKRLIDSEAG